MSARGTYDRIQDITSHLDTSGSLVGVNDTTTGIAKTIISSVSYGIETDFSVLHRELQELKRENEKMKADMTMMAVKMQQTVAALEKRCDEVVNDPFREEDVGEFRKLLEAVK